MTAVARYGMQLLWNEAVKPLPSFRKPDTVEVSAVLLEEYVGEYALFETSRIVVSRSGDRLFVKPTGRSRTEAFPSSDKDFFLDRGQVTLTFGRDKEGGRVTHLTLHQRSSDRRLNRVSDTQDASSAVSATLADNDPSRLPTDADLPAPEELFARHLDARGGLEALAQPETIEMTSRISIPSVGLEGTLHARYGRDLRFASITELGAAGTTRQGYVEGVGWMIGPRGEPEILEGARLRQLEREANWLADAQFAKLYADLETQGRKDFHGFDCWVVRGRSPAAPSRDSTFYFEAKTGLLRGREESVETAQGPTPVTTVIRSYGTFGGDEDLRVANDFELIRSREGITIRMTVTDVVYDSLSVSAFELPLQVLDRAKR